MEVLDQPTEGREGKSVETVLAEGYSFDLGAYISEGFKLFGKDAGPYIGFFFVSIIISAILGNVPFIGPIAGLLVNPALAGGWYIYARYRAINQEPQFGNFFDGFKSPGWIQLVLANLVTGIFTGLAAALVLVPAIFILGLDLFADLASLAEVTDPSEVQEIFFAVFTGKLLLVILLTILISSLITVLYILAPMFVLYRGMTFWDAMESSRKVVSKNYLQFLMLLLVLLVLIIVGFMLCCVGLMVAMPVMYLSLFAAFKHIMGVGEVTSEQ